MVVYTSIYSLLGSALFPSKNWAISTILQPFLVQRLTIVEFFFNHYWITLLDHHWITLLDHRGLKIMMVLTVDHCFYKH